MTFREGDRVLQQRNDYQKEVFNGDLGTVVAVDGDGSVRVVFGDRTNPATARTRARRRLGGDIPRGDTIARAVASGGREVSYSRAELRDLIPAWRSPCTRRRGSEYRAVVLCLASNHRPLLRRELVYTAVSRAKEVLVVLAPPQALETAVASVGNDRRCTMLARRLAPLAPDAPSCPRASRHRRRRGRTVETNRGVMLVRVRFRVSTKVAVRSCARAGVVKHTRRRERLSRRPSEYEQCEIKSNQPEKWSSGRRSIANP